MHSSNALYTDLSGYYDLMCADIDYQAQSQSARRLHQFFGAEGKTHLDLACGTGPHIRYFLDAGYQRSGLDLNQPMLDNNHFVFESGWNYSGVGEEQSLNLSIEKTTADLKQRWQDQHPMVAISFAQLEQLLCPCFEVHILEHNDEKIAAWDNHSGNALFVCVKR